MTHERGAPLQTTFLVAGAVLIGIIALALHPHLVGHPAPQAELRQIGALSIRDRLVHGTLLLLLGALLVGFVRYALRRGITRQAILVGLVSFAIGICALVSAGLIDGFILPELASRFVAASPTVQDAAIATLAACSVAVNVTTAFGLIAMALAIGVWSLDLARIRGEGRAAGALGVVSAALTIAVLAMSGPSLKPHALMAVFGLQGAWYVWIAVLFARGNA